MATKGISSRMYQPRLPWEPSSERLLISFLLPETDCVPADSVKKARPLSIRRLRRRERLARARVDFSLRGPVGPPRPVDVARWEQRSEVDVAVGASHLWHHEAVDVGVDDQIRVLARDNGRRQLVAPLVGL